MDCFEPTGVNFTKNKLKGSETKTRNYEKWEMCKSEN